ncbi:PREDICTED: protein SGT1 homolog [Amphimedon queenslandica]|uniref:CS domain-containing protein n=1 Tax=Amphimedon queenslandica TaxID=400682 RepID=A0A1X7VN94_AMPQE|nr:PREDICTED: protein SGT1 homolog [Amphimedon queenslandica]|eukprot:XP_003383628.1 PREDICTED: protein SGT1 homolog [Amphimedon queenslandica]
MAATGQKLRYDWYQTISDVSINVLVKADKRKECSVHFEQDKVVFNVMLTSDEKETIEFNVAEEIVPEASSYKELKSKVEIKLRKKVGINWSTLERKPGTEDKKEPKIIKNGTAEADPHHAYPSSSHYTRNWDKLVGDIKKEEEKEKPEGDAALNSLFQQIYSGGDDEVKKAMNKSFVESGGTVLSTNWGEVGNKKVEVKPPDGMEFKKYEM